MKRKLLKLTLLGLLAGSFMWSGASRCEAQVRLAFTEPCYKTVHYFTVHAEKIGVPADRRIFIHYRPFRSLQWQTTYASQLAPLETYDNFVSVRFSAGPEGIDEFVIGYETSEGVFWDNNNGQNYRLGWVMPVFPNGGCVGGNVAMAGAEAYRVPFALQIGGQQISIWRYGMDGEIAVQNLSFEKQVFIRLTTDNWNTWRDVEAQYDHSISSLNGVEIWTYQTPLAFLLPRVQFAVCYRNVSTGQEYWDNNFGRNYRINSNQMLIQ